MLVYQRVVANWIALFNLPIHRNGTCDQVVMHGYCGISTSQIQNSKAKHQPRVDQANL